MDNYLRRLLFIYNPMSGRGRVRSNLLDMIDRFVKSGYRVEAYPTQYSGDAKRAVIERDDGFSLIVCSGGDGTLDEVVSGMMESGEKIPIGYIPAGSTNDFAGSLGIPSSMKKAATVAMEGREFDCDVGRFNNDYFVYVAAFGMFTDVSYDTDQHMKNMLGHMAYIIEGAKRLSTVTSYHCRISYTDEKGSHNELEDDYLFGMITNSRSVGGFKNITGKKILLDDGIFEMTLVKKPLSPLDYVVLSDAIAAKEVNTNIITSVKASKIELLSDAPVAWTLDGEYGGDHISVNITNENKALTIMVP
ncbi:MAG: YegS/Rv2252/BmrU family lipid kinase [Lachnospiraceae bacterium]|nr:YegS/Rv2252/BmrU family lipid kinase [Lachnospiraceae bacterium]